MSRKVAGFNHGSGKVFHLKVSFKELLTKTLACSALRCVRSILKYYHLRYISGNNVDQKQVLDGNLKQDFSRAI